MRRQLLGQCHRGSTCTEHGHRNESVRAATTASRGINNTPGRCRHAVWVVCEGKLLVRCLYLFQCGLEHKSPQVNEIAANGGNCQERTLRGRSSTAYGSNASPPSSYTKRGLRLRRTSCVSQPPPSPTPSPAAASAPVSMSKRLTGVVNASTTGDRRTGVTLGEWWASVGPRRGRRWPRLGGLRAKSAAPVKPSHRDGMLRRSQSLDSRSGSKPARTLLHNACNGSIHTEDSTRGGGGRLKIEPWRAAAGQRGAP